MPDGDEAVRIDIVRDLGTVARDEWDACAGAENPFVSHDFLYSLEESRSACAEEGWLPQHLIIQNDAGRLIGAVPLYLKGNSQGEYVFDYGWAHAYERAGGQYYPKLLSAVPFTPVTGPRLMVRPGGDQVGTRSALIAGLMEVTRQHGVSSLHVNFATEADADALEDAGFLIRHGQQYHWHNQGYSDFNDFLDTLSSRKRKNIRKERQKATDSGLRIERLTGDDLTHDHWDAFYLFYKQTYDRKWGHPYLTRQFFHLLQERMRDRVMLVLVYDRDVPVAGALNLIGTECLYGRNWGSDGRYPFLHFEACYYQAIDFAIERGLARVEAGTQGEHKVQRGYLPVRTYSAHHIVDPGFRDAVERFLVAERNEVSHVMEYLDDHSPYKKGA
jgi:predicted N-acyltransferase